MSAILLIASLALSGSPGARGRDGRTVPVPADLRCTPPAKPALSNRGKGHVWHWICEAPK